MTPTEKINMSWLDKLRGEIALIYLQAHADAFRRAEEARLLDFVAIAKGGAITMPPRRRRRRRRWWRRK